MINKVILSGNVVRDSDVKTIGNGAKLCKFSIAVNKNFRLQDGSFREETSYIDIDTWSYLADKCEKGCKKGRGVTVVGRIKQDRWLDDKGGMRSKLKIVAENVEFREISARKEDVCQATSEEIADLAEAAESVAIEQASGIEF